jgi:uncharacterized protein (DUF433 family)
MDWSDCTDVARIPGRVSGQPVIVGTRILARCVSDNMDDASAEAIDFMFPGIGVGRVRRLIDYARRHADMPHPAG